MRLSLLLLAVHWALEGQNHALFQVARLAFRAAWPARRLRGFRANAHQLTAFRQPAIFGIEQNIQFMHTRRSFGHGYRLQLLQSAAQRFFVGNRQLDFCFSSHNGFAASSAPRFPPSPTSVSITNASDIARQASSSGKSALRLHLSMTKSPHSE